MTMLRAAVFALGLVCLWGSVDAGEIPRRWPNDPDQCICPEEPIKNSFCKANIVFRGTLRSSTFSPPGVYNLYEVKIEEVFKNLSTSDISISRGDIFFEAVRSGEWQPDVLGLQSLSHHYRCGHNFNDLEEYLVEAWVYFDSGLMKTYYCTNTRPWAEVEPEYMEVIHEYNEDESSDLCSGIVRGDLPAVPSAQEEVDSTDEKIEEESLEESSPITLPATSGLFGSATGPAAAPSELFGLFGRRSQQESYKAAILQAYTEMMKRLQQLQGNEDNEPSNPSPVKRQEGVQEEAAKAAILQAYGEMMKNLEQEAVLLSVAEIMNQLQQLKHKSEGEADGTVALSKR